MNKHTPGPYGIYENPRTAFPVITRPDKDGIRIVGIAVHDPEAKRQQELEATGKLLKSAPELLAALEQVLIASEDGGGFNDVDFKGIRAAIAKAKGEYAT